ncbi:hypothetical protein APTSU1_000584100 [Apodemus speciosus]|uniref:Uncharacterized protein n=1 Tax=Apodemus speciosus TaxID=105296 RepID=A0ABQ0EUX7_APOSI
MIQVQYMKKQMTNGKYECEETGKNRDLRMNQVNDDRKNSESDQRSKPQCPASQRKD